MARGLSIQIASAITLLSIVHLIQLVVIGWVQTYIVVMKSVKSWCMGHGADVGVLCLVREECLEHNLLMQV